MRKVRRQPVRFHVLKDNIPIDLTLTICVPRLVHVWVKRVGDGSFCQCGQEAMINGHATVTR